MRGGKEKRNRHWGRETVGQFSLVNFLLVRNKGRDIKKRKDKGRFAEGDRTKVVKELTASTLSGAPHPASHQ